MFFSLINWKKFLKLWISLPAFLIFLMICSDKPEWWVVPVITFLWTLMLFISAHSNYIMMKSRIIKNMSTKEKRKFKLKKINRFRLFK